MSRPICSNHPNGRVRRNGYYGKNKAYVRWECVPADGSRPHQVRPELSTKLVGGIEGDCPECERRWLATDGLPTGTRDRFTLSQKATALVALSRGETYRAAALAARKTAAYSKGWKTSRDGRLTGDWVSQYAPIIRSEILPSRWPYRALLLDDIPFSLRKVVGGKRVPSGVRSFHILAAAGYSGKQFQIWALGAYPDNSAASWEHFLQRLDGEPSYVVADRGTGLVRAVSHHWPHLQLYPCVSHLAGRVREILELGGMHDTRRLLWRMTTPSAFSNPAAYLCFRRALDAYLNSRASRATPRQVQTITKLERWIQSNEEMIALSLAHNHWPVSTGALEEPLRRIRASFTDRRFGLRNLDRLDDLLSLMAIQINGDANARTWAKILRENHRDHAGTPPPRRLVDNPALAPR